MGDFSRWSTLTGMKSPTGRKWDDPTKQPAKPETMDTQGDFRQFTETMRTMLKAKPEKKPASPGAAVS
jgi:hypothetical protein